MATKKTLINLTLIDGTAEGTLKCVNKVQNGTIYRINRNDISNHLNMPEMRQCGIYFLIGDINGMQSVYIGQANTRKNGNGVLGRVLEHKNQKEDYWREAFILVSSTNSIGATELNYLENQFCNMVIEAGHYNVVNASDPNSGNYNDEIEIIMDPLIEYTSTCLKVLGYDLFSISQNNNSTEKMAKYHINKEGKSTGRKVNAQIEFYNNKYRLKKGSLVALETTTSCPESILTMRNEFKKYISKEGIVKGDIDFNSPSTLAKFVTLSSVNGKVEIRDENGRSIKNVIE